MDTTKSFINDLSAQVEGDNTGEDYVKNRIKALEKIDDIEKIVNNAKINTMEDYDRYSHIKSVLSSLFCFTANNKKQEFDRVCNIESKIGDKLVKFVKKQTVKDRKVRALIRYVLWNKYYMNQDMESIYDELIKNDVLRKKGSGIYVIGLHYKVGDNTFTVDAMGRQHRNYVGWTALQAISVVSSTLTDFITENNKWSEIPELEDRYSTVTVCDGKYCIRPIRLKYEERDIIRQKYVIY